MSQDQPTASPRPMSPRLLRRLAQAALGSPERKGQWWVCRYEPDPQTGEYDIEGPMDQSEAQERLGSMDSELFGVFGPYELTPGEGGVKPQSIVVRRITVESVGAEPLVIEAAPYDAIFWSSAAVEKFLLPYYTLSSGIEYAGRVDQAWRDPQTYLLVHSDDTEYTAHKAQVTSTGPAPALLPIT
jgi:hypothetical protein